MSNFQAIGSFSKVRRGASPRPIGDPRYFGGEVGWVRISDVTQRNKKYLKQTEQYLSELGESKSLRVDKGDLIMSICATVGKPMIVDMPACIHDGFVQIYDLQDTSTEYLYYLLQFHENDFEKRGQPGTQVNLNTTIVEREVVFFPKYQQQTKIAKILSTVDNLIDQTQNIIDKYKAVKQGMMADLFSRGIDMSGTPETNKSYGQLRPNYEDAPELYQETELGWVPKGWDVHPVENVAIGGFKNGYFKDPKLVGSGKKLINVTELYQDFGIDITTDKVERIIVSPKDFEKYKVDIGDLFFTRSSLVLEGIAKSNIVRNLPEEAVFECHVMRLKPNKEFVVPEFLALFTGMPKARSYLMSMAKQVTMTTIAQPDMVGLPTPVPSLNEQQAIVEKIDAIDELIRKEKETVEKNKNIKKGLMQDLLTGKVKV